MITGGITLVFNIEETSLLDINDLIDKGKRFKLEADLAEEDYDNLKEYLKNEE